MDDELKAAPNDDESPKTDYSSASSASSPLLRLRGLPVTFRENIDYLRQINDLLRTILAHPDFEHIRSQAPLQATLTNRDVRRIQA